MLAGGRRHALRRHGGRSGRTGGSRELAVPHPAAARRIPSNRTVPTERRPVEDDEGAGAVRAAQAPPLGPAPPARPKAAPGGSAAPRPVTPGDNAVYRIDADGVPREVLRVKALVHALAWADDRLLVGTGPEGQLYEVRERGEETAPIAKLDNGQILSLLAEPTARSAHRDRRPRRGRAALAGVSRRRTLVSEVHDTKLISRFGALTWRADLPPGHVGHGPGADRQRGRARRDLVGLVARTDRSRARPGSPSPPGRFVQYRAKLATSDPRRTPELRSVALELPDGEPRARDHAARRARPERRRRRRPPDPAEPPLGRHRSQRRRARASPSPSARRAGPNWIALTEEPITREDLRLGHDGVSLGFVPGQGHRQRPAVQQPRRRPDARAREPELPRRSRPAARPAGGERARAPGSR